MKTDGGADTQTRRRKIGPRLIGILIVVGCFGIAASLTGSGDYSGLLQRFLLKTDNIIVEHRPDPAYDRLYPYYVEYCAVSQWRALDGRRGNPFGHALAYIKGACKDESAPFPLLRRCHRIATDVEDSEHGVGVSVGRWFRNVNWIAIPGYRLTFDGGLDGEDTVNAASMAATARAAIDRGVFDGVELHPEWTRRGGETLEDFVIRESLGTDFAVQFARNAFCARVPVTEAMLDEVIAFLNDKNEEYATGNADYNWHLLANNCVHTMRNALAAANVWSPLSVLGLKLLHVVNPAVPANEFVNLAILGADGPLASYRRIRADGPLRDALHEFRWLPTRQGALVKTLPVHQRNDVFETGLRLFTVQSPFRMGKAAHVVRLLSDPRHVDVVANLDFFAATYDEILADEDTAEERLTSVRGTRYRRIDRLHQDYIAAQRAEVSALERRLAAAENSASPARDTRADSEGPAAAGARNAGHQRIHGG